MSVDELFRPILPEPTLASGSPRGYSPHLKRVWQGKLIFLSNSSRCEHVEIFRWKNPPKNLLCCLHWRKPSSFVFCYSFIWTVRHALLPDSVISPRARMKMCFRLSITFFMGRKFKRGPSPPCHLVGTYRAAARYDGQRRQASTPVEASTVYKMILMLSWRRS